MGIDLIDVKFRLQRKFGVEIKNDEFLKLATGEPPDIMVGDLFNLVHARIPSASILDIDLDGQDIWWIFQQVISDALGVDLADVAKDQGLIHDLGAS